MSNHIHIVLTDHRANLPEFTRRAHRHIAACMNAEFGWSENFWSPDKTSVVVLEDASAVLRKLVYTRVNPVAEGLVRRGADWPGLHTADLPFGASRTFARPKKFFRANGPLPKAATLTRVKPPMFVETADEACTESVNQAVREEEEQIRKRVRAEEKRFLGPHRCRRFSRSYRPRSERAHSRLSPAFATLDRELYLAALSRRRAFLTEYRDAYERWRQGDRDAEFPPGTYWLRVHAGVRCRALT